LHVELSRIVADPEVKARFAALGLEPVGLPPNEFGARQRADMNKWNAIIRDAGITAE
jgi:tripartite-type tricarboxylate transporter receptor subunit TctC